LLVVTVSIVAVSIVVGLADSVAAIVVSVTTFGILHWSVLVKASHDFIGEIKVGTLLNNAFAIHNNRGGVGKLVPSVGHLTELVLFTCAIVIIVTVATVVTTVASVAIATVVAAMTATVASVAVATVVVTVAMVVIVVVVAVIVFVSIDKMIMAPVKATGVAVRSTVAVAIIATVFAFPDAIAVSFPGARATVAVATVVSVPDAIAVAIAP